MRHNEIVSGPDFVLCYFSDFRHSADQIIHAVHFIDSEKKIKHSFHLLVSLHLLHLPIELSENGLYNFNFIT